MYFGYQVKREESIYEQGHYDKSKNKINKKKWSTQLDAPLGERFIEL